MPRLQNRLTDRALRHLNPDALKAYDLPTPTYGSTPHATGYSGCAINSTVNDAA
jgi:hypothetical protein